MDVPYSGPYCTASHATVTRGHECLGGSTSFWSALWGFSICSYIFFCWNQKCLALCFFSAVCNLANESGSPEGRVRDDRLEKACPWISLQPDVHADLYLGRLRCCLSRSLPVCVSEIWAGEPPELHTQLVSKCLWIPRDLMGCDENQQNPQEHPVMVMVCWNTPSLLCCW